MSKLAKKIPHNGTATPRRPVDSTPGPRNQCWPLYGPGDQEDWEAVDTLRREIDPLTRKPRTWASVQDVVDREAGVDDGFRLDRNEFRRHWLRRCACWPKGLKL